MKTKKITEAIWRKVIIENPNTDFKYTSVDHAGERVLYKSKPREPRKFWGVCGPDYYSCGEDKDYRSEERRVGKEC